MRSHFINGGVDLMFVKKCYVPQNTFQMVENSKRSVLWDGNILRPDGLLPCHNPNATIYCPVYESPCAWVVCLLTLPELFCIYQIWLSMDALFEGSLDMLSGRLDRASDRSCKNVQEIMLPSKNSPSSTILTSIIQQLWGDVGGFQVIEAGDSVVKSHNIQEGRVENVGMEGRVENVGKVRNATTSVMTVK